MRFALSRSLIDQPALRWRGCTGSSTGVVSTSGGGSEEPVAGWSWLRIPTSARARNQPPIETRSLTDALAKLSPDVRAAVVLVHWRGLDYAAAAEILGIPAGTVGSRLNKARRVLRDVLRLEEQSDERRQ